MRISSSAKGTLSAHLRTTCLVFTRILSCDSSTNHVRAKGKNGTVQTSFFFSSSSSFLLFFFFARLLSSLLLRVFLVFLEASHFVSPFFFFFLKQQSFFFFFFGLWLSFTFLFLPQHTTQHVKKRLSHSFYLSPLRHTSCLFGDFYLFFHLLFSCCNFIIIGTRTRLYLFRQKKKKKNLIQSSFFLLNY